MGRGMLQLEDLLAELCHSKVIATLLLAPKREGRKSQREILKEKSCTVYAAWVDGVLLTS